MKRFWICITYITAENNDSENTTYYFLARR